MKFNTNTSKQAIPFDFIKVFSIVFQTFTSVSEQILQYLNISINMIDVYLDS